MTIHFINAEEWGIEEGQFMVFFDALKKAVEVIEGDLNVIFVNDEYIRALNKAYRGKDKSTDVLSFNYDARGEHDLVGEIYISVETAKKQAADFNHGLEDELNKLFVHGFLHIHGYDHEEDADYKVMHAIECEVLGRDMT